jgi:hypothetical protein
LPIIVSYSWHEGHVTWPFSAWGCQGMFLRIFATPNEKVCAWISLILSDSAESDDTFSTDNFVLSKLCLTLQRLILTFSVLTCQAEQFMSDSAEILIFKQSNALQRIIQISDAFRQVCSAVQGQIFSLGTVFAKTCGLVIKHTVYSN